MITLKYFLKNNFRKLEKTCYIGNKKIKLIGKSKGSRIRFPGNKRERDIEKDFFHGNKCKVCDKCYTGSLNYDFYLVLKLNTFNIIKKSIVKNIESKEMYCEDHIPFSLNTFIIRKEYF